MIRIQNHHATQNPNKKHASNRTREPRLVHSHWRSSRIEIKVRSHLSEARMHDRLDGEGALGKATRSPRSPLPTPLRRGGGGTPTPRAPEEECARAWGAPGVAGLPVRALAYWTCWSPHASMATADGQLNLKRNGPWEASVRRELDWFAAYSGPRGRVP